MIRLLAVLVVLLAGCVSTPPDEVCQRRGHPPRVPTAELSRCAR